MLLLLNLVSDFVSAQTTQMKRWYISPFDVNVEFGQIVTSNPVAGRPTAVGVANGIYDRLHNLIFYVSDGNVFDPNNTYLGPIQPHVTSAEIAIVPFGDNDGCTLDSYNIFTMSKGNDGNGNDILFLVQSVVNRLTGQLLTGNNPIDAFTYIPNQNFGVETGALAVGPILPNGDRFLYYSAASGTLNSTEGVIRRVAIHPNGTVGPASTIFPDNFNLQNPALGTMLFTAELDLSPDGEWLAWGRVHGSALPGERYYFIQLYTPSTAPTPADIGNYVPYTITGFDIVPPAAGNTADGARGVEFYRNPTTGNLQLFVGAGSSGIYSVDVPGLSTFRQISGSGNFGFSQLELANNQQIYASSTSGAVAAIDPMFNAIVTPPINPSFTINNPLPNNHPPRIQLPIGPFFYTLPDQIDGENYDAILTVSSVTKLH
jgi:hypothetical protein